VIDLHNHILPGQDDGAADLEESLEIARQFVFEGVVQVAATPHRNIEKNEGIPAEDTQGLVTELQAALDAAEVPLQVVPGAELLLIPEAASLLENGTVASLDESKAVLVELSLMASTPPLYMDAALFELQLAGFQPVLAHPERYPFVQRNRHAFDALASRGIVFQLTAPALLGDYGGGIKRTAEALLKAGLYATAASDRHHPGPSRSLAETRQRISHLVGADQATLLLETNPARLLRDEPVIFPPRQEPMPGLFTRIFRS
jgi:protein-tyrosine phosphatase